MTTQEASLPQTTTRPRSQSIKFQRNLGTAVALILLTLGASLVLLPLVWMVSTSLKTDANATVFPPQFIPKDVVKTVVDGKSYFMYTVPIEGEMREMALFKKRPQGMAIFMNPTNSQEQYEVELASARLMENVNFHWENYPAAMTKVPFLDYTRNTLLIVLTTTFGVVISCTIVAYGFSRFRAPFLDILFLVLLSTIMLPQQVTLIPQFVLFQKIGWYDTFLPLIVPAFFSNAWNVFLLRQFFMSVPIEMDEAAKIDGASPLGVLWHILLPQAWPAVATVAIFHFLWSWNDFYGPLIYLQSKENWTIAIGLQSFKALYSRNYVSMMAAATVTMLPCLLLFFIAQKLFIQGVVVSGIKG